MARTPIRKTSVPPLAELTNTAGAMALTKFSRRHVYRLTADGLLPVFKIGGSNRYWVKDLEGLVHPARRAS